MDWGQMIFVAVAVRRRQYLEQAVKISGDNSFVGVKYDNPGQRRRQRFL